MTIIKAYFEDMSEAGRTVKLLKEKGFNNAHLDMLQGYYEEYSEEIGALGDRDCINLMSMALTGENKPKPASKRTRCSSATISSIGSFKSTRAANTSLVVNLGDQKPEEALKIIRENGGIF